MTPITPEEAMLAGYVTITSPYTRNETAMLEMALATFQGCNVVLVAVAHGTEIWRKKTEIRIDAVELSAADVRNRKGAK